ncbi:hypothetical protein C1X69_01565 [Pseudomonas sp. FW305-67]|nr:hypothetical protein C1X70_13860 [Pseudomonas sp. FW305-53]PMY85121.1 hypothetical protein C1X68_20980 [Pseudomonas sp. FW303-C2]PMY91178.1 hypothetical protein C1X67_19955 [Pseudomonas sp. FW305-62]PNA40230.1 hypothetical protein C1X71_23655 [Pseudomonas sp. FW306-2-2C-A10BC]PNA89632.1 hypothetical protein C1X66_00225 [Pseudomonas sp. MPR-R3B]PNB24322.1 hypothetical protein C1X69_01565 [Pseudomonas sp. FW305-67]
MGGAPSKLGAIIFGGILGDHTRNTIPIFAELEPTDYSSQQKAECISKCIKNFSAIWKIDLNEYCVPPWVQLQCLYLALLN